MNEKDLNEQRKQDQGLKAALERRAKSRPQMPQGLNERVMQRAAEPSRQKKSYWWAVAASVAAICVLTYAAYDYMDGTDEKVVAQQSVNRVHPISRSSAPNNSIECTQSSGRVHPIAQSSAPNQRVECSQSAGRVHPVSGSDVAMEEQELEIRIPADEAEPEVVYASVEVNKDTVFKAPAMMEKFVEKMAEFCKAEAADLDCLKSMDDSTLSRMYVIEDSPENEVFERLIQMAVWYDNDAPGYFLTFSQKQFLFQLHDPQQNLKYFVMAERINAGRILLYSMHVPLGKQISMGCYLEYRNKQNGGKLIIES